MIGMFLFTTSLVLADGVSCTKVDYCKADSKLTKEEANKILKDLGLTITTKITELTSLQVLGSTFGGFTDSAKTAAIKDQVRAEDALEKARQDKIDEQKNVDNKIKDKNKKINEKDKKIEEYKECVKEFDAFSPKCMGIKDEVSLLEIKVADLNKEIIALQMNLPMFDVKIASLTKRLKDLNDYLAAFDKFKPLEEEVSCLQAQIGCVAKKAFDQIDNTPEIQDIKPDNPIQPEPPKPKECPFPSDAVNKAGGRISKDITAIGSDPNGVFRALGSALNEFANKKDDASAQAINDALDAMNKAADQNLFYFGPQGLADYKALRGAVNEFKKCLKERNCPPGKPGDPKPNKDGKKVYFFTGAVTNGRSWCPPCQRWRDDNPGHSNIDGLVIVEFLKPDNPGLADPSQKPIADKYYNSAVGVPQFVFVDKDGNKVSGSASPSIQSIKDFLNK